MDCECREERNPCDLEGQESLAEEMGSALDWDGHLERMGKGGEGTEGRVGIWVVAKQWR